MGSTALRMLFVFGTGVAVGWFMSRQKRKAEPAPQKDAEVHPLRTEAQLHVVEPEPEPAPDPAARVRCEAKKRDGAQCTRESLPGTALCWQHTDE